MEREGEREEEREREIPVIVWHRIHDITIEKRNLESDRDRKTEIER